MPGRLKRRPWTAAVRSMHGTKGCDEAHVEVADPRATDDLAVFRLHVPDAAQRAGKPDEAGLRSQLHRVLRARTTVRRDRPPVEDERIGPGVQRVVVAALSPHQAARVARHGAPGTR